MRRRIRLVFTSVALTCALGLSSAPAQANIRDLVFPPRSEPLGISYPRWVVSWARWAFEEPIPTNPFVHPDNCDLAVQVVDGAVFLPSSGGGHLRVDCPVPADTPILVSPGGTISVLGTDGDSPDAVKQDARATVAKISGVHMWVDGRRVRPIDHWRTHTEGLFTIDFPQKNLFGYPPGVSKAFLIGWFVMVHPLSPGEHKIYAQDLLPDGSKASVTYRLTVKG